MTGSVPEGYNRDVSASIQADASRLLIEYKSEFQEGRSESLRHGMTGGILTAVVVSLILAGCGRQTDEKRYEAEFLNLFDTVTQIIGYSDSKEDFESTARYFHDELEQYHKLYDIYNDYEGIVNIKTINDQAGGEPVKADRRIIDLLLLAQDMYNRTGGRVNVAMGSVLSVWHDYRSAGIDDPEHASLPEEGVLKIAAQHTDIHDLIIDVENGTVMLKDPQMSLDVGAIAKGYAVEQVCGLLSEKGMTPILASVGGNVKALGLRGDRTPWQVGIQNPDVDSGKVYLYKIRLTDAALVTSGDYQRYYTVDGKRYHHIINPDTLYPSDYFQAVSIVCPDSGLADALSTAVFNLPLEQGRRLLEKFPGTQALWVMKDGSEQYSSGFPDIAQ